MTTADQQRPAGFSQALAESAAHELITPRQLSNCLSIVLRLGMFSAIPPHELPYRGLALLPDRKLLVGRREFAPQLRAGLPLVDCRARVVRPSSR